MNKSPSKPPRQDSASGLFDRRQEYTGVGLRSGSMPPEESTQHYSSYIGQHNNKFSALSSTNKPETSSKDHSENTFMSALDRDRDSKPPTYKPTTTSQNDYGTRYSFDPPSSKIDDK